jgi:hypothetical protein
MFRRNILFPSGSRSKSSKKQEAGGKQSLLFNPEEGGYMFLQNIGLLSQDCKASYFEWLLFEGAV